MPPPRSLLLPAAVLVLVVVVGTQAMRWRPASQVVRKQAAFFEAVENRRSKKIGNLLAGDYLDQWGLDKINALRACDDLKQYFLTLEFRQIEPSIQIEGREGVVITRVQIVGTPAGPGTYIKQKANRLETPFHFTWKRQGFLPWSWRLTGIGNEGIPSLEGYDPSTGFDEIPGL